MSRNPGIGKNAGAGKESAQIVVLPDREAVR
jgi:hypothetical protein